jgi:hypothetical protein
MCLFEEDVYVVEGSFKLEADVGIDCKDYAYH